MLKKLAEEGQPGVQYAKVDLQKTPEMGKVHGVSTIPDTRIFHNGKQIGQFVGNADSAAIEEMLATHLATAKVVGDTQIQEPARPTIQRESAHQELPSGIQRIPAS